LPAIPFPAAKRRLVALSLACASACWPLGTGAQGVDEARLQAAFVAKFPAFVHWPAHAWTGRASVAICVYRSDAAASYLRELVAGELVGGRPMTVVTVSGPQQVGDCHVLFVPDRADARLVTAVATRPILTIGVERGFLDAGGIIALRRDDRRVRFEVDRAAADRAGLQLSSQLLRLAVAVHGRPR
jgi:hypothetical protein